MLPHEYQARANRQTQEQALQRVQWEAWCRVSNVWLESKLFSKSLEVRIDGWGENHLHVGSNDLLSFGAPSSGFLDMLRANRFFKLQALGSLTVNELLFYLDSEEAKALYELEVFAGR